MGAELIAAWTLNDTLSTIDMIVKVALGLGFVVFVHELGHFLAAKACGVKCEKFYVGFDVPIKIGPISLPRTFGKFRWGETEYGIGVIPLGGYVKMLGQDDNPSNAAREAERIRVKQEEGDTEAGDGEEDFVLDPRSYPAKPVWQRMIIISAGVIMNLIFAVILGSIAYQMGVKYTPCEIAGTSAGDPAWIAGLEAGDKLIQIGRNNEPDEHLRFDWELRHFVIEAGMESELQPLSLLVRRADGEEAWFEITPTDRLKPITRFVTLGVRPPHSTTLASVAVLEHFPAGRTEKFQEGDTIVAVDGERLPVDEETGQIFDYELERMLAAHRREPTTFTVRRAVEGSGGETTTEIDVEVPANRMKTLGLEMTFGPIVGVRADSPAAAAGFKRGDRIVAVDGQPVGDPMTLPNRVEDLDREVVFDVERGQDDAKETVQLTVTPRGPPRFFGTTGHGSRVGLERIGVAYSVTPVVAAVLADSPAAKAGIQAGDKITQAQFSVPEEKRKSAEELFGRKFADPIELNMDISNWPYIQGFVQRSLPEMSVQLTYVRDETKTQTDALQPVDSDEFFVAERGFNTVRFQRVHTAESLAEAASLGFRETKEKLYQVLSALQMLVTAKVSPRDFGGPIAIAAVAGSEASQGIPRLLVFLTFLSANLAILNFLPIPALDGGHMMFLSAELVTGRPVDERIQGWMTIAGLVCLLGLMVFVFANDIEKFFL